MKVYLKLADCEDSFRGIYTSKQQAMEIAVKNTMARLEEQKGETKLYATKYYEAQKDQWETVYLTVFELEGDTFEEVGQEFFSIKGDGTLSDEILEKPVRW